MTITLKTLPDATARQVFEHVAKHLLTQNRQSRHMNADGTPTSLLCQYRLPTADGPTLMCAAGALIAEDEYDYDRMENRSWSELVRQGVAPDSHLDLISELQYVHDSYPANQWRDRLKTIADNYAFKTDFLETIPA